MKLAGLLFFLVPLNMFGQNLTGTWIGRETGASYLKLVIVQLGDSCFGYTYDEGPGYCQANFAGHFDGEKQKLKGKGISFIARSRDHVLCVYNLNYIKNGEDEYLQGQVAMKGTGVLLSIGAASFAQLQKVTSTVDSTRFMQNQSHAFNNKVAVTDTLQTIIKKPQPAIAKEQNPVVVKDKIPLPDTLVNVKKARVSKMVSTIYTNVDTVKMMLYDNGEVDDDTVTVFFDNRVILDRYRITEKAKELDIPVAKNGQPHTVELFANNLGTIPPNTALIIILAGKERYEVHASYDLSTNATIILQYKE